MAEATEFHVVTGSYAHVLYGYDLRVPAASQSGNDEADSDGDGSGEQPETRSIPRYVYESHVGSVTCLAMAGTTLVSGAADESIKVYNLVKQKEVGTLFEQQGTVTCLEFCLDGQTKHLISGSDDGSIVIWNASSWEPLKTLRGHKGSVADLSIHPSGRIALSVGRDRTLMTWNLVKGRQAFVKNLKRVGAFVQWFDNGNAYAVGVDNTVQIYSTATGALTKTLELPAKALCIGFSSDNKRAVVGAGDQFARVYDLASGECILTIDAHDARIRNVAVVPAAAADAEDIIVTSSTDGAIRVWRMPASDAVATDEVVARDQAVKEIVTQDRLTCMTVLHANTAGVWRQPTAASAGKATAKQKKNTEKKQKQKQKQQQQKQKLGSKTGGKKRGATAGDGGGDGGGAEAGAAAATANPAKKRKRGKKGATDSAAGDGETAPGAKAKTAVLKPKPKSKLKKKKKGAKEAAFETVPVQASPAGEAAPFDEDDGLSSAGESDSDDFADASDGDAVSDGEDGNSD